MIIEHYQSLLKSLRPLSSVVLNFNNDGIVVNMFDTANTLWVNVIYKVECELSNPIAVEVGSLANVKGDVVDIKIDGNKLVIKDKSLTHKINSLSLIDSLQRKNRNDISPKWEFETVNLTHEDILKVVEINKNSEKYNFIINNGMFSISSTDTIADDTVQFDIECESNSNVISRFHGINLEDIIYNAKWFDGCQLFIGNDVPLFVKYTCEWMDVNYMLACMNRKVDG